MPILFFDRHYPHYFMLVKPTGRWKSPILRLTHLGIVSRSTNRNLPVTVSAEIGARLIAKNYAIAA
jgi:hypothetical protein